MNELIKTNYDVNSDRITVLGRDLHKALEVKTKYKDWFPRMCEYGFTENEDYIAIAQKRATAQGNETTYTDHQITLDMAKEICMLQRSEKGKMFRQYFIEVEKEWNNPDKLMARALLISDRKIKELNETIKEMLPKALFADAVSTSDDCILVGDLAKLLKQNGVETGQKRLYEWLRNNNYLIKQKGDSWNMPTQRSMDKGLFRVKETAITHSDGNVTISKTVKVTGKGQHYFIERFLTI